MTPTHSFNRHSPDFMTDPDLENIYCKTGNHKCVLKNQNLEKNIGEPNLEGKHENPSVLLIK